MKALLALNESTTAEILADLLQIDPEQAQAIAGQMRLSEILSLVQELKSNNTLEATEILKPYLAELGSGNKNVDSRAKQPPKTVPAPGTGASGPPGRNYPQQAGSNNVSPSTVGSTRSTVKGQTADAEEEQQTGEPAGGINVSMTDPNGNEVYSGDVKKSGAMRAVRQLPKFAKGSAIRNIGNTA